MLDRLAAEDERDRDSKRSPARTGTCATRRKQGTDAALGTKYPLFVSRRDRCTFPSRLTLNSACDPERATSARSAGRHLLSARCSDKSLALGLLAGGLAGSSNRFSLLPVRPFGRLLVEFSALHLAKNSFALHFFLEYPESLINVVVANEYLQETFLSCSSGVHQRRAHMPLFGPGWNDTHRALPAISARDLS